jgi:hypothetical protein
VGSYMSTGELHERISAPHGLAGNFSDRAESLIAIHDRQGELNCA